MTRGGSSKSVDPAHGKNRLVIARGFLKAAEDLAVIAEDGTIGNSIASVVVNAAIAYADALTSTFASRVNQKDHAAAVRTLRDALGNGFPKSQETRLARILASKDLAQYGGRFMSLQDGKALLEQLRVFATWAESELSRIS